MPGRAQESESAILPSFILSRVSRRVLHVKQLTDRGHFPLPPLSERAQDSEERGCWSVGFPFVKESSGFPRKGLVICGFPLCKRELRIPKKGVAGLWVSPL